MRREKGNLASWKAAPLALLRGPHKPLSGKGTRPPRPTTPPPSPHAQELGRGWPSPRAPQAHAAPRVLPQRDLRLASARERRGASGGARPPLPACPTLPGRAAAARRAHQMAILLLG